MKFENVVFPDSIGFKCKNCGACCRLQPPDVNSAEQKQIEEKGFSNFLCSNNKTGIRWIRRKKDGSCFFFTKNNKCAIYTVRPAVCRLEPFTLMDYDYERKRIEVDLNFPASCGCEGILDEGTLPIEEIGKAAQMTIRKILELTAKDLSLPPIDPKVASETRSRILRKTAELALEMADL